MVRLQAPVVPKGAQHPEIYNVPPQVEVRWFMAATWLANLLWTQLCWFI